MDPHLLALRCPASPFPLVVLPYAAIHSCPLCSALPCLELSCFALPYTALPLAVRRPAPPYPALHLLTPHCVVSCCPDLPKLALLGHAIISPTLPLFACPAVIPMRCHTLPFCALPCLVSFRLPCLALPYPGFAPPRLALPSLICFTHHGHALPGFTLPCTALPSLTCPALHCAALPCLVPLGPTLPRAALPCCPFSLYSFGPMLPYLTLTPRPALPCLAWHSLPFHAHTRHALYHTSSPFFSLPCLALLYTGFAPSHPALSSQALPLLALPCDTLPYPSSTCLVLRCPTLPLLALHSRSCPALLLKHCNL